ncbi:hypothetical protein D3C71_751760 [compost metagenome]
MRIVADRQNRRAEGDGLFRKGVRDIAADHQAYDFVLRRGGEIARADHLAVPEHGVIFGDLIDFVELVADEEDRLALPLQIFDDAEEIVDFLAGKSSRRFVHDDDARLDRQRAGDGDEMALGNGQVLQPDRRIDGAFELFQQNLCAGIDGLPVNEAETAFWRMTEEDVFAHGKLIEQHGFLVNGGDTGIDGVLRAVKMDRLAIEKDFTLVGAIDAGEDFDERGFSSTVLADQSGDLAGIKRDIDAIQGFDAGEYLADAAHFQNGR